MINIREHQICTTLNIPAFSLAYRICEIKDVQNLFYQWGTFAIVEK